MSSQDDAAGLLIFGPLLFMLVFYSPFRCCIGFAWQDFSSEGGYRGGFCEKLLEASPMSNRASASWFQDGSAIGQSRAHQ